MMSSTINESFAKLLHSSDGAAKAIQEATRQALIHHGKAERAVPVWRDEKVVWVHVDENGEYAADA